MYCLICRKKKRRQRTKVCGVCHTHTTNSGIDISRYWSLVYYWIAYSIGYIDIDHYDYYSLCKRMANIVINKRL